MPEAQSNIDVLKEKLGNIANNVIDYTGRKATDAVLRVLSDKMFAGRASH